MAKGSNLIRFNCKNGKYCLTGEGAKPKELNYLTKFSWQPNVSTKKIYGDGEIQMEVINDKGATFTLGMTAICEDYEVDMKRELAVAEGKASIKQTSLVGHNIYLEVDVADKGKASKIMKVWILNVTTEAPQETLDQSTEDINESGVEHVGRCLGVPLMSADGKTQAEDEETGHKLFVTKISCLPDASNYSTFGDSVPVPKLKA